MGGRGVGSAGHRGAVAVALVLTALGCRDGVGPELRGARVQILHAGAPFNEETVGVGRILQLTGQVLDATGKVIAGEAVAWSSGNGDVLGVDANGSVVAKALGSSYVVASHRAGTDTAWINVAASVTGALQCAPGEAPAYAPGEARTFTGDEAVRICLPGGSPAAAEYVLIAANVATSAGSILPIRLLGTGVTAVVGPPQPFLSPAPLDRIDPVPNDDFHRGMRERVSARLEPLLRSGVAANTLPAVATQLSPNQLLSLNVGRGTNGCDDVRMRTGRVQHLSARAAFVVDTLNPGTGFSAAELQEFGRFFDEDAWPLITGTFGEPSDIDRNGRVIVFFTIAVNDLRENSNDPQFSGSYVGGFFFNRDLFPRSSCAGSNTNEMFYLLAPDSVGTSGPNGRRAFPRSLVRAQVPSLIVHEFQHLVNDSRRLHVNASPIWEETWLNEGLSHIAEELMFYRAAGLQPRQNINLQALLNTQARDAFRRFQLDNVDRLTQYLAEPEAGSLMGADLLVTRGAAWSFLRYAADRHAAGESNLWTALVRNSRHAGLENLRLGFGGDAREWIQDWLTALYLDDTGVGGDGRHRITSWNFRSIYPGMSQLGVTRPNRPYPLSAPRLFSDQARNVSVRGGTAAYARFGVAPDAHGAVRVTVGGNELLPPPSRLKVTVIRTR